MPVKQTLAIRLQISKQLHWFVIIILICTALALSSALSSNFKVLTVSLFAAVHPTRFPLLLLNLAGNFPRPQGSLVLLFVPLRQWRHGDDGLLFMVSQSDSRSLKRERERTSKLEIQLPPLWRTAVHQSESDRDGHSDGVTKGDNTSSSKWNWMVARETGIAQWVCREQESEYSYWVGKMWFVFECIWIQIWVHSGNKPAITYLFIRNSLTHEWKGKECQKSKLFKSRKKPNQLNWLF